MTAASGGRTKRIAHIADANGWRTSITIVNLDTVATPVTITFHRSSLTPADVNLTLSGLSGNTYTTPPIPVNGSLTIYTTGSVNGPIWQGWAELAANANIGGFAIFQQAFSSTADAEGAVAFSSPGITRFMLPFDNTNSLVTSMALVNPSPASVTVTGTFRDEGGNPVTPAKSSINLGGHTAFETTNPAFFGVSGTGVAQFSAGGSEIFGIGLLFNPLHSFTSLPILAK